MGRPRRYSLLILVASVALVWAAPASAQRVSWWGEYRLRGDYLKDAFGQDWILDHELTAHARTPLFAYRLGSLDLTTGLFVAQGSLRGKTDSAMGLGRLGLAFNMFPYRKFPFTLYYERSSRPELFGAPKWDSTVLGARMMIRSTLTGSWWLNAESDRLVRGADTEERRWFSVMQNRMFGRISTDFSWRTEKWNTFGPTSWRRSIGTYNATLPLPREGALFSATVFETLDFDTFTTKRAEERLLLNQRLGQWGLVAEASWHTGQIDTWKETGYAASSTLYRDFKSLRAFGGGAYSTTSVTDPTLAQLGGTAYQAFGGATWMGRKGWTLTADGSFGTTTSKGYGTGSATSTTIHFGLGKDQSLPSWISRLAFNFRDISFERRMSDLYPPGYVPAELQFLRREYYETNRNGRGSFHADLYHRQESGGARSDTVTADGQLSFNHTLLLYTRAEIRQENDAFSGSRDSQSLLLNARYKSRTKPYTAGVTLAYGRYSSTPGGLVPGLSAGRNATGSTYSIGANFSTVAWHMPWNAGLLMINQSGGGRTLQLTVSSQFDVRDLHLRWVYSYDRDVNGWYRHRLYFDALRLFRGNAL